VIQQRRTQPEPIRPAVGGDLPAASIKRLYDVYGQSLHARATFGERLSVLESATGWALQVRDDMAGELVAEGRRAFGQRGTAADRRGFLLFG
jgi:hypothetical protein